MERIGNLTVKIDKCKKDISVDHLVNNPLSF